MTLCSLMLVLIMRLIESRMKWKRPWEKNADHTKLIGAKPLDRSPSFVFSLFLIPSHCISLQGYTTLDRSMMIVHLVLQGKSAGSTWQCKSSQRRVAALALWHCQPARAESGPYPAATWRAKSEQNRPWPYGEWRTWISSALRVSGIHRWCVRINNSLVSVSSFCFAYSMIMPPGCAQLAWGVPAHARIDH